MGMHMSKRNETLNCETKKTRMENRKYSQNIQRRKQNES